MKIFITTIGLLLLIGVQDARAALGDKVDSIASDQKLLTAKVKSARMLEKFSVQEIDSGGSTIDEYVGRDGVIFAVTWHGRVHPNLAILLGSYYESYNATEKLQPKVHGQHHKNTATNNLVVQKYGHMRDLRGRAYDTSLIPAGVSLDEIK